MMLFIHSFFWLKNNMYNLKIRLRKNNSVYLHKLFKYFIHYQCYIKISVIFLSISSIFISYFTIPILWDMKSSSQLKNQVIPFLNNISLSKDFWWFSYGLYNAIKIASKFFLRCFCEGAGHKFLHLSTWSIFLLMCSASSNLGSRLLSSDQRVTVFHTVSPM